MTRALLVTMLLLGAAGGAMAQSEPAAADSRCWHGSQSYSGGSLVRVGGRFYACSGAARWEAAENGGANCIYEDRNYTSGALVAVGGRLLGCEASGAWVAAAAEE